MRVFTTDSPLADPDSPIHTLASQLQHHIYLPDPMPLYVLIGTLAGNMLRGNPIWLMLVGQSSSGKTLLLKSLVDLPRIRVVSSIKGEAALLSGVKAKERSKDATGGVLCELGDNGCLVFMDFTSVLSKSREAQNELLGALREIYDGTWSRDIGGEGGRHLDHKGKVSLMAGVTHAIDRSHEVSAEMGQRCLFYRLQDTDGYQECMQAANNVDPKKNMEAMRLHVVNCFAGLGLSFEEDTPRREMGMNELERMINISQFAARARSSVPRDMYTRQIVDVAGEEAPPRITEEMTQLYLGMEAVGVSEGERWRAVGKVALDSMPLIRRLTLECVVSGMGTSVEIARKIRVSDMAARRAVEDLDMLGVVRKGTGGGGGWKVTEWTEERMEKGEIHVGHVGVGQVGRNR